VAMALRCPNEVQIEGWLYDVLIPLWETRMVLKSKGTVVLLPTFDRRAAVGDMQQDLRLLI